MGLREELAAVAPRTGIVCTVCDYLAEAPKDDAEALNDAMADAKFRATTIQRALANMGVTSMSVGSIRRHRRQECYGTKSSG
jgi:hypothetical protein